MPLAKRFTRGQLVFQTLKPLIATMSIPESTRQDRIEGCLLGCAVGDAVGLPYEGMRPARINRLRKLPLGHRFVFGRGMVSDDTDHSIFVAQALLQHPVDSVLFQRCLAWKLRWWLLCLPAGIGLATLRSILRLWVGFSPTRSGVYSAGNGPAMRSAIIGAFNADDRERLRAFVSASSHLTHVDPKAEFGAQAVAALAALGVNQGLVRPSLALLRTTLEEISDESHWRQVVDVIIAACEAKRVEEAIAGGVDSKGVSGYTYHTVPVAIVAWYVHFGDYRATVESIVALGGDTDTVAAIAGALAGSAVGRSGIPEDWIAGIVDYPHGVSYIRQLSLALARGEAKRFRFSPLLLPRGLIFTVIVLAHGFRRLLPPYG